MIFPKSHPMVVGLLLLVGSAYLLPNYAFNGDGVSYAGWLRYPTAEHTVHVHHLAYLPLVALLTRVTSALGLTDDPYLLETWLSLVSGIACLLLLPGILRRTGVAPGWLLAVWLLFATGAEFRHWSTIAGTYLPTLVFLLLLYDSVWCWYAGNITWPGLLQSAGWLVLATAMHQLAILVIPGVVLWGAWQALPGQRLREGLRILVVLGLPIMLLYVGAYLLLPASEQTHGIIDWLAGYAGEGKYWVWNHPHWASGGIVRFVLPAYLASHVEQIWALPDLADSYPVGWEPFSRALLSGPTKVIELLLALVFCAALFFGIRRWRTEAKVDPELLALGWLGVAWSLPMMALTLIYEPQHGFYRLFYFIPLMLPLLRPWVQTEQPPRAVWFVLLLTIALNAGHAWIPMAIPESNPTLMITGALQAKSGPLLFPEEPRRGSPDTHLGVLRRYCWHWVARPVYRVHAVTQAQYDESTYAVVPLLERLADAEVVEWFHQGCWLPLSTWEKLRAVESTAPIWRCFRGQPGAPWPEEAFLDSRQFVVVRQQHIGIEPFVHVMPVE